MLAGSALALAISLPALCAPQTASAPASAPATAPTPAALSTEDERRLGELITLIEGPNSPQARRTGARELLRQNWPETPRRLAAVLTNPNNRPAKIAVALALSDLPESLDPVYIAPLLAMLADSDAEVRAAAAAALALYRDGGVIEQLRAILLDGNRAQAERLAAVDALGRMIHRGAMGALVDALEDPQPAVSLAALTAIERTTGMEFRGDPGAARRWWNETRDLSPEDWQRVQIERLVRAQRGLAQRLAEMEQRLHVALRDNFFRTPDPDRPALLSTYLTDPMPAVRLLGLDLVRTLLAEGKPVAEEVVARVRDQLAASESEIRVAAVRTLAGLRNGTDAARLLAMLAQEQHPQVRLAVVNALGYLGAAESASSLTTLLSDSDPATQVEAVIALGRLAERGVLDAATRDTVGSALLARYQSLTRNAGPIREQLVRALSRLADPRFGSLLLAALDAGEPSGIRQAAARGLAILADTQANPPATQPTTAASQPAPQSQPQTLTPDAIADALAGVAGDADLGVRKPATEALAQIASREPHLQALWARINVAQEPDESLRETAWRGAVRYLSGRGADEIEGYIQRLPDGPLRSQRTLELLRLAERLLSAELDRARRGAVRARIAELRAADGAPADAIAAYSAALEDFRSAGSPELPRIAAELLRVAVSNALYTADVAALFASQPTDLDGESLWSAIRPVLESMIDPARANQAVDVLTALNDTPPAALTPQARQELARMLERARNLNNGTDGGESSSADGGGGD